MNDQGGGLPPAGWFPDPYDANGLRWWDGRTWTNHYAPRVSSPAPSARGTGPTVVSSTRTVMGDIFGPSRGRLLRRKETLVPSLSEVVSQLSVQDLGYPLHEQIEVAGETYYAKGIRRVFAEHRMPITARGNTLESLQCAVVPERWNPHDPNAVAVMIGTHHVGHVPAELARHYSPPLLLLARRGILAAGNARVWAKDDGGMVRARVTICLPEAEVL